MIDIEKLKFDEKGLIPAIVVDSVREPFRLTAEP